MKQREFNVDPYGAAMSHIVNAIRRAKKSQVPPAAKGVLGGHEEQTLDLILELIAQRDPASILIRKR